MGRVSTFDQGIFDEICHRLATGETLRAICRSDEDRFPLHVTLLGWVVKDEPKGIADQYARAREACMHSMIDETVEIADDGTNDWMTIKRGGEDVAVENREVVNRSRLRVDTRKWLASKICPKLYGDRLQAEVTGASGGPIAITVIRGNPPEGQS